MAFALGAADAFDAVVYGQQHPGTLQYLQNQVSGIYSTLTAAGQQWMQKAKEAYETFNGAQAMMLARQAIANTNAVLAPDVILYIHQLEQFQQAQLQMQRYIMANPALRQMYHQQRVDGYSQSYVDYEPGRLGWLHYDYRRVMDGVCEFNTDDNEKPAQYTEYFIENNDHEMPLKLYEKVDILSSWQHLAQILATTDDDPTSNTGGKR